MTPRIIQDWPLQVTRNGEIRRANWAPWVRRGAGQNLTGSRLLPATNKLHLQIITYHGFRSEAAQATAIT